MRRYLKEDGEWFDEHLCDVNFTLSKLIGRMVSLQFSGYDDAQVFMIKGDISFMAIIQAPDGSVLDIADYLDTTPPYGIA